MSKDPDIIPLQEHERVPDTKDVSPGADGAMIDPELVRRFMDFRRSYRALEAYMRRQGLDLKSE